MWQPTQQRDGEGRRREVIRGNDFIPSRVATGVMATACLHKEGPRNTGNPNGGRRVSQPDAREGQAGPCGVADRLVVPRKPSNVGGGKEPLRRVHECVFGVLALESEPVDPRL